jgi:hypothetical protein
MSKKSKAKGKGKGKSKTSEAQAARPWHFAALPQFLFPLRRSGQ